jgi:hypothetical protein
MRKEPLWFDQFYKQVQLRQRDERKLASLITRLEVMIAKLPRDNPDIAVLDEVVWYLRWLHRPSSLWRQFDDPAV